MPYLVKHLTGYLDLVLSLRLHADVGMCGCLLRRWEIAVMLTAHLRGQSVQKASSIRAIDDGFCDNIKTKLNLGPCQ